MNILTIIPARAGSKGIQNKNIRKINGAPLIIPSAEDSLKRFKLNVKPITTLFKRWHPE